MFVKVLNILVAEWIKIPAEGLSPLLERKLHERLVFTNPDYEMRHNRGEWIGNIPPQISCLRQKGRHYLLPRGFLDQFVDLCKKFQQPYRIVDRRRTFEPLPIEFHGELKSYQQDAAEAVLDHDCGTLVGGHKSGKTVIALYTIAQRRQPTLILLPKLDLLEGWLTKIENFLQIPSSEVGMFSTGVHQIGKYITIGHTGEVIRYWRKLWEHVGYLIVDECQRCPSKILTNLIPNFDCRYILGLTNTTQRKDRLSRLVYYYVGDVVYTINDKDAREGRGIIHAHVVTRQTDFEYPYSSRADYPTMLQALMKDEKRNRIIADDIEAELQKSPHPLIVLSGGEEQEDTLGGELRRRGISVFQYRAAEPEGGGDTDSPPCPQMPVSEAPQAVFVTAQTLTRCSQALSSKTLVLAVPLYFRKNLALAIRDLFQNGSSPESKFKIYDYVDHKIGLLENFFRMRSYNYGVHPDVLLNPSLN
ncbi:DEAD/DEAH box helicase [Syntrophobacter fumaroxidans]|uniref:Type III restriction enzyme, res subunit n=1 Tax=Syntrophobacter fumaroxidans (strain DSM 10017 / MPOB) TaxID=335543 RepID=A0LF62_SYNFM|nr:DEAD/DEAH box helicase family protein [Syntrophobacter fumaroxidans]ABK16064.1 type III restriction enzyme, res subunit [Syntrophobacter fumaroxidans MPOB]